VKLDRVERIVVGAFVYGLGGAVWMFELLDTGVLHGREALGWSALVAFAAVHFIFGFALRSWLVLAFPSLLILLAALAGYPDTPYETPPLWFWQGLLSPFLLVLLAFGVSVRRLADRLRGVSARSS
jgi:hypothetical protein